MGVAAAAHDPPVQFPENHWDTLVARIRGGRVHADYRRWRLLAAVVDFLVNIAKDLSPSPISLGNLGNERRAVLPLPVRRAPTRTTLQFVGYSLADVNFRVILRALVGSLDRSSRKLSVTLQLLPESLTPWAPTAARPAATRSPSE